MRYGFVLTLLASFTCEVATAEEGSSRFSCVNLEEYCNQKLDANFHAPEMVGHNLSEVPRGRQVFCGIPFEIGEGCLQLRGSVDTVKDLPAQFGPIAVGQKCKSMHFLHSAGWGWLWRNRTSPEVGEYVIQYEDGSEAKEPIVCGVNVRNWIGMGITPQAAVAWRGKTPHGETVELLATSWENPHPEKSVKNLVMRTKGDHWAAPFCLAVTADRGSEGLEYEELAVLDDIKLVEGVWVRRRGKDEAVNWIIQELVNCGGRSSLAALDADGDVIWKNEGDFVIERHSGFRVFVLTNIDALEGNNKGTTWPGPWKFLCTIHEDQLVMLNGMGIDDDSRPEVVFWSRKRESR